MTAYEMRISDWSSDVCASDLILELAFEHRNHLPLIGAVLAIGDLLALAMQRLRFSLGPATGACILLVLLGTATLIRANTWGSRLDLDRKSTRLNSSH